MVQALFVEDPGAMRTQHDFHHPGRSAVYAGDAMAATSHPLATQAAVDILRAGGNAVDAAIAASAVLCVVEPESTGIGGDCFMLYAPAGGPEIIALNGSGRAPAALTADALRDQGHATMPTAGPHAVTVPGAVDAWARMLADHGTMSLARVLEPAIHHADAGYPVSPRVALDISRAAGNLVDPIARATFTPGDTPPRPGDVHRQPLLAATLRAVADGGRDAFYRGANAAAMVAHLRGHGGQHTEEDFAAHASEYVTPIRTTYRGHEVVQIPPNGQGITALIMLNILQGYDLGAIPFGGPEAIHLLAEATRLAYAARNDHVGDMDHVDVAIDDLLSDGFAATARDRIDPSRSGGTAQSGGVVYRDTITLAVVDKDRNACSHINSLFHAFGGGLMCERTGVVFQNRGACFNLIPGHPNELAPNKRPLHTIIPGMMLRDGRVAMAYGVMGGQYQPVGHAQVISAIVDHGMDVQTAIDAPRTFAFDGVLGVEAGVPEATRRALSDMGHTVAEADMPFGGGQAVMIDWDRGVLIGGSDPRKDGCALGF